MTREQSVRWFDVKEKKPPTCEDVLVSDGEYMNIGQYYGYDNASGDMWGSDSGQALSGITHWMFLPLGPKAVVTEETPLAQIGGFWPDTDPTPRGDKTLGDYRNQLEAKRKRRK